MRRRGLTVSYLPQHPLGDERTPLETVLAARPDLAELDRELHRVSDQLGTPELAADLEQDGARAPPAGGAARALGGAGGPSIDGRARATAARRRDRGGRPRPADDRALGRPAEADRARRLPRAGSGRAACSTSRRPTSTPSAARCSSGCSRGLRRRRGRRLARPLPARRDGQRRSPRSTAAGSGCGPATTRPTRSRASSSCSASSSSS